jgi:hypothetical protein
MPFEVRGLGRACWMAVIVLLSARLAAAEAPIVSVWYRGSPAGLPRLDDLAFLRSLGFTAVSWPARHAAALPALRRYAQAVGMQVVSERDAQPPAAGVVSRVGDRVRIRVDRTSPAQLPALAWLALARGAGVIGFDTGEPVGHGVAETSGAERGWVRPAIGFARQVAANAVLFDGMQRGPDPIMESGASSDSLVAIFAAVRTWVLIAANGGDRPRTLVARFPPDVPYAIWTSLVDGSTMSMLSDAAGPRLTLTLAPGHAAVYFADR